MFFYIVSHRAHKILVPYQYISQNPSHPLSLSHPTQPSPQAAAYWFYLWTPRKQMGLKEDTDRRQWQCQSKQKIDKGNIQQHPVTAHSWWANKHDAILDLALLTLPVFTVTYHSQWHTQCSDIVSIVYLHVNKICLFCWIQMFKICDGIWSKSLHLYLFPCILARGAVKRYSEELLAIINAADARCQIAINLE